MNTHKGNKTHSRITYKTGIIISTFLFLNGCSMFTEEFGEEYGESYTNNSIFAPRPTASTGVYTSGTYQGRRSYGRRSYGRRSYGRRSYGPRPRPYHVTPKDESDYYDLNARINQRMEKIDGEPSSASSEQSMESMESTESIDTDTHHQQEESSIPIIQPTSEPATEQKVDVQD